jgi:signal transduction histidine kinase/CheY-like chemotaxis protein
MDDNTLILAATPLTLLLTIGMLFLAWSRPERRYVLYWAGTNLAGLIATLGTQIGDQAPPWLNFALTGPAYYLSVYCTFAGFAALARAERFRWGVVALLLCGTVATTMIWQHGADRPTYQAMVSAFGAPVQLMTAFMALRLARTDLREPLIAAGILHGFYALVSASRGAMVLGGLLMPALAWSPAMLSVILLIVGILWIAANFNFVWLIIADDAARHARELGQLLSQLKEQAVELRAAKTAAEAASAAKSTFLATMSHEIRTPLNGVIGFAEVLLRSSLSADQRRYVMLQRDAGNGLLTVLNDILDFSKLEAGEILIETARVDLPALLDSCSALFRAQASEKALDLTVQLDARTPRWIRLDGHRLRQVVTNLLSNAVKFTRKGGISIAVRSVGSTEAPRIRLEVSDTGIGIPTDKLDRLFRQFSQVDGSISREFGGTGLGLAISRRIVTLMGGELGVESEAHSGSVFWVEVPFELCRGEPLAIVPERRSDPRAGIRILVAEDVEMNRLLIEAMLTGEGHQVAMVGNGAAAVDAVARDDFDLVLMDVRMPVMDGLTAARLVRKLPGRRGAIPIMALTANVMPEEIADCRAAGMQGHIAKPIDLEKLRETLAGVIAEAAA